MYPFWHHGPGVPKLHIRTAVKPSDGTTAKAHPTPADVTPPLPLSLSLLAFLQSGQMHLGLRAFVFAPTRGCRLRLRPHSSSRAIPSPRSISPSTPAKALTTPCVHSTGLSGWMRQECRGSNRASGALLYPPRGPGL